jgi:hypothetical protein
LQLGWRPTTPEEEEDSDEPEYYEVDLTQEWNTIEPSGIVPSMGKTRGEGVGEVLAIPSTSQGAEKVRETPAVRTFSEKSSWAELEGQPISKVHDAIVKKLKGTPEALRVDEVEMMDEACVLEFVKKWHKKVDLIRPYIQARREMRMRMLETATRLRGLGDKRRREEQGGPAGEGIASKTQKL